MVIKNLENKIKLVVINKGEVGAGVRADLTIRAPIGEVLSQL